MARLVAKSGPAKPSSPSSPADAGAEQDRAVLAAVDQDRTRLAQELHDTVCQTLSGLRLSAAALRRKSSDLGGQAVAECAHVEEAAAKAIGELHEIIRSLQAQEVTPADLAMALEELARETAPVVPCEFRSSGRPQVANAFTAGQVLRIAQAALQHAQNSRGIRKIVVDWHASASETALTISADSPCFAGAEGSAEGLLGWKLLLRRAAAIGAVVSIEQKGAEMKLTLPILPE